MKNKVTAGPVWQVNREQITRVGNKLTSSKKVVPREKVPAEQIHWGTNSLLHRPPQRLCRWSAFAVALLSRRLCRFGLRRLRWAWGALLVWGCLPFVVRGFGTGFLRDSAAFSLVAAARTFSKMASVGTSTRLSPKADSRTELTACWSWTRFLSRLVLAVRSSSSLTWIQASAIW